MSEYILISKAATLLGVSQNTLRNWEAAGKIKVKRHPMNNYRMYSISDLKKLRRKLNVH